MPHPRRRVQSRRGVGSCWDGWSRRLLSRFVSGDCLEDRSQSSTHNEPVVAPPVRSLNTRFFIRFVVSIGARVKLIIAIVQPDRLEPIKEALSQVEVFRLTVVDCLGYARQKGDQSLQRAPDGSIHLLRKLQLQIAVNEEFVEPTVQAILRRSKTCIVLTSSHCARTTED